MDTRNELDQPLVGRKRGHVIKEGFMKYLVAQEFLERVALRGVQSILAVFLLEKLHFHEVVATELVHLFLIGLFITPIIGSSLSDGYTGNYTACYIFSFCELLGLVLITISAIPVASWRSSPVNHVLVPFALVMVVLGSGALKPCQVTFGGDQMMYNFQVERGKDSSLGSSRGHKNRPSHEYFSAYYMAMNLGTLFSAVVSPLLRVNGHGSYLYVFLMPACSMALCILSFWWGRKHYYYRPVRKILGTSNTQPKTIGSGNEAPDEKATLLDVESASPKASYRQDLKDTLYVLLIVSPCVFFTAMFFQTSSTWVFQARSMDGHVPWLGGLEIQPDQMPALNPVLVVFIIPLMDNVVYPFVEKFKVEFTNLKRIVLALVTASLAFVTSGLLQMVIDSNLKESNPNNLYSPQQGGITILWQIPQYFLLSLAETLMYIPVIDWAYVEAPESTKTVVQAALHVYSAVGNLITITVVAIFGTGGSKVTESFTFAALGACAAGVMTYFSSTYITKETRAAKLRAIQSR
ncbi:hypothetical protein R1flu_018512 [Riccia fluitans]|uniref:Peptide transporter n=1 Tax=Riccia fluitans TaxID=41844 RepID=A0ABD1ZG18_9MARC